VPAFEPVALEPVPAFEAGLVLLEVVLLGVLPMFDGEPDFVGEHIFADELLSPFDCGEPNSVTLFCLFSGESD